MFAKNRKLLSISAAVVIAGVAYWQRESVLLLLLILTGTSPECPFSEAFLGARRRLLYNQTLHRIQNGSRYLARDGRFRQVETSHGRFWEAVPRSGSSETIAQVAEIESKYAYGARSVRPGDIVLDCGANIGVFTRYALNHGAAKVVAIEPAPNRNACGGIPLRTAA
jgi:hypothetical protein